jgi:hypothetical protein
VCAPSTAQTCKQYILGLSPSPTHLLSSPDEHEIGGQPGPPSTAPTARLRPIQTPRWHNHMNMHGLLYCLSSAAAAALPARPGPYVLATKQTTICASNHNTNIRRAQVQAQPSPQVGADSPPGADREQKHPQNRTRTDRNTPDQAPKPALPVQKENCTEQRRPPPQTGHESPEAPPRTGTTNTPLPVLRQMHVHVWVRRCRGCQVTVCTDRWANSEVI